MKNKNLKLPLDVDQTDYLHYAIKLVVGSEIHHDHPLKGVQLILNGLMRREQDKLYHPDSVNKFSLKPPEVWALYKVFVNMKTETSWQKSTSLLFVEKFGFYLLNSELEYPQHDGIRLKSSDLYQLAERLSKEAKTPLLG